MIVDLRHDHADGCVEVVCTLPEWFGYPGALDGVAEAARTQEGFVFLENDVVVGFVTTLLNFDESLEIAYLAVMASHRRSGIGRQLVASVCDLARGRGVASLCLLTLGPSADNPLYAQTVAFYRALGFWRTKELSLSTWSPALLMCAPLEALKV